MATVLRTTTDDGSSAVPLLVVVVSWQKGARGRSRKFLCGSGHMVSEDRGHGSEFQTVSVFRQWLHNVLPPGKFHVSDGGHRHKHSPSVVANPWCLPMMKMMKTDEFGQQEGFELKSRV